MEERYFARLSNFTPLIDFVMEKDIWRGIKAIRKESGRFRFPSSPFCFTLLNRESRKIGRVIVGGGKMEWKERKRVLTRRKNKNRLFLTSLFNLSLDRKICRVKGNVRNLN